MSRTTIAKIALAFSGIALFLWASHAEQTTLRWIAIALVAAAWLLRFVERGNRRGTRHGPGQGPSM